MNEQNIIRLEEQLEKLVEGAFNQLFAKRIAARDLALHLARAMEDGLQRAQPNDERLVAPDKYTIYLHPEVQSQLLKAYPNLTQLLGQYMVELATQAGYRLLNHLTILIVGSDQLTPNQIVVQSSHLAAVESSTGLFQQVQVPTEAENKPINPQLIINGARSIPLKQSIINIGRSPENHIVLEDPYISRHHIQLRMRFGTYVLFDIHSKGGTFVNNVAVREHRLQSGDVIRIGHTQLVYMQDDPISPSTTQAIDVVDG